MTRSKKTFLWIAGVTGIFIILLTLFFLLARHVINIDHVKTGVISVFTEKTGGQLAYEKAEISFFPRSRIVLHSINFSIPEKINGSMASLTLYPRLLPLLKGKVQIAGLKALQPDLILYAPELLHTKSDRESDPWEIIGTAAAKLKTMLSSLEVNIEQGRLNISEETGPAFLFRKISARTVFHEKKSTIRFDCKSNLWESLSVNAKLNQDNSEIDGQVIIHGFKPHKITEHLFPHALRKLIASQTNLAIDFQGTKENTIHGRITGDIPDLTLQRKDTTAAVKARNLKGSFQINKDIIEVLLDDLELNPPRLKLSGKFQKDRNSSHVSLELEGRDIDVDAARKTVLAVAGDIPVITNIFDIVKNGHVPLITCTTHGNSLAELGKLKNLTIKGRLMDGGIFVPGIRRDLDRVKGNVIIADGILKGKDLAARLGNSLGKNGSLKIGLSGKNAPFHLDIMIDADLAQLPPVLKQVVRHKEFLRELDLIDGLGGNATGRLVLGESLDSIKTRVVVDNFNLSGTYKRIPYPVEAGGDHFSYDKRSIAFDSLKGKIGNSAFSSLVGHINFNDTPLIDVSKGEFSLKIEEFYPWISTFDIGQIPKKIQSAAGSLTLSQMHLKGPLFDSAAWNIDAVGNFHDIVLHSNFCPDTISVKDGHFRAFSDTDTKTLSFSDTHLTFLDAALTMSGLISINLNGPHKFETLFKGDIGQDSNRWIFTRLDIPPELTLSAPLSVSSAYISWKKQTEIIFIGDLNFPRGQDLHLDLVRTPEEFRVNDVSIKDAKSMASARLNIKDAILEFNFQGDITKSTSDKIFAESNLPDGWVDGRLNAYIHLDQPMKSKVQGDLKGGGLKLLRYLGFPLDISTIALTAEQNHIRLTSTAITMGEDQMMLEGDILFSKDGLHLDMDLSSNGLNGNHIKKIMQNAGYAKQMKSSAPMPVRPVTDGLMSGYPVTGMLRLKSDSLVYGKTTWQPFNAEILLDRDTIDINVTHAEIQGISTPGEMTVKKSSGDLTLKFKTQALNQPLGPVITWLSGGKEEAKGVFDLDGVLMARCPPDAIATSLTGDFELTAKNGNIFRAPILSKILTFLNSTEILFGKNPGIGEEGFAYKSIKAKATLDKGRLILKETVMDGASMELICQGTIDLINKKIDLTVLVAPLKTVDRIIKITPLVGYVLAGSLVSIPLKVTGDYAHPKISILPVSAVGKGLLGIIERTLKLPLKIIDPILPKN